MRRAHVTSEAVHPRETSSFTPSIVTTLSKYHVVMTSQMFESHTSVEFDNFETMGGVAPFEDKVDAEIWSVKEVVAVLWKGFTHSIGAVQSCCVMTMWFPPPICPRKLRV